MNNFLIIHTCAQSFLMCVTTFSNFSMDFFSLKLRFSKLKEGNFLVPSLKMHESNATMSAQNPRESDQKKKKINFPSVPCHSKLALSLVY